jgi:hypothetical protein
MPLTLLYGMTKARVHVRAHNIIFGEIKGSSGVLCSLYCGENNSFSTEHLERLLLLKGHAVVQFVEALRYKSEGRGSITDDFIGILR